MIGNLFTNRTVTKITAFTTDLSKLSSSQHTMIDHLEEMRSKLKSFLLSLSNRRHRVRRGRRGQLDLKLLPSI